MSWKSELTQFSSRTELAQFSSRTELDQFTPPEYPRQAYQVARDIVSVQVTENMENHLNPYKINDF